jgi:hypothetical protein
MGFLYNTSSTGEDANRPATSTTGLGLVLTDASDDVLVPASLSYVRGSSFAGDLESNDTEIRVGIGFRALNKLSMGLAVERLTRNELHSSEKLEHNLTTGILFTPTRSLGLSAVFHDMLNTRNIPMNPTTTLGAFWSYQKVWKAYFDWSQPQKNNTSRREIIAVGMESAMTGGGLNLRTGGRWDQYIAKRFGTMGLGWDGPNLCVDYAYEKNLDADEYRHLVDMRIQF